MRGRRTSRREAKFIINRGASGPAGAMHDKRNIGMVIRSKGFFYNSARVAAFVLVGLMTTWSCAPAQAQSVIASVNGDPLTNVDLVEREKLLRALGEPSSSSDAMESLIRSRVEAGIANKFNIKVTKNQYGSVLQYYAERRHTNAQALYQRLLHSGAGAEHVNNFLSIETAFLIYAHALNRAVQVGDAATQAEIAKNKTLADLRSYTIRQVMIAVSPSSGIAGLRHAVSEMNAVRARFHNCDEGVKLTSEFHDLIVRDPLTRTSSQLGDQLTAVLNKTPVGHLTQPSRDSTGLVAIAVCSRKKASSDEIKAAAREIVLGRIIRKDAEDIYKKLRAQAVIVKPGK